MAVSALLLTCLLPLAATAGLVLSGYRWPWIASSMVVFSILGALGTALYFLAHWDGTPLHPILATWLKLGDLIVSIGLYCDAFAALMLFVVTFVGFWIAGFSLEYMKNDSGKSRFFGGLSLFLSAMLGLVLADNLFVLFFFWELVGFSSYLLIAHYWETSEACEASKKAFIVNRIGDLGFLIGIILCYAKFGTVELSALNELAPTDGLSTGLGLLLMCGFLGKSAQLPLHVWLPDAMAGPTPISALIHAATMVAAGIYFLCRIHSLLSPDVLTVILVLGATMTVYAGFCALGQRDIKKILAHSTLVQLGYMAVAVGLGYPGLALFHLTTHAFFKALLFLSAGSVLHACHHEQDIFKLGGLWKRMPFTSLMFIVGALALAGAPFTSGYFSKDAIIIAAFSQNSLLFAVLFVGALLTSLYIGRLFWIAFMGKPKSRHAEQARETGLFMRIPMGALAIFSLVGGWLEWWPRKLRAAVPFDLESLTELLPSASAHTIMGIAGNGCWILLLLSVVFYRIGATQDPLEQHLPWLYRPFRSCFYFDAFYRAVVVRLQDRLAYWLSFLDLLVIAGLFVRGSALLIGLIGTGARRLHSGSITVYAYWFLAGFLLLCLFAARL